MWNPCMSKSRNLAIHKVLFILRSKINVDNKECGLMHLYADDVM